MRKFLRLLCLCLVLMLFISSTTVFASGTEYTEYLDVSDAGVKVKTSGYYVVLFKSADTDKKWATIVDAELVGLDSTKVDSSVWVDEKVDKGALLYKSGTTERQICVLFSEDGKTTKYTWEMTVPKAKEVETTKSTIKESDLYPIMKVEAVSRNTKECKYKVNLSVSEYTKKSGYALGSFTVTNSLNGEVFRKNYADVKYKDSIEVILDKNDTYEFKVTDSQGNWWRENIEVGTIVPDVTEYDDGIDRSELSIVCKPLEKQGLVKGDVAKILITASKLCDINVEGKVYSDVKSVEHAIQSNGTYRVTAYDEAGNSVYKDVKVDFFGEVKTVKYDSKNRDSYWNGVSYEVVEDTDKDTQVLPQTGETTWYILIGAFLFVVLVGVCFILHSRGVLKLQFINGVRRNVKTDEDSESKQPFSSGFNKVSNKPISIRQSKKNKNK